MLISPTSALYLLIWLLLFTPHVFSADQNADRPAMSGSAKVINTSTAISEGQANKFELLAYKERDIQKALDEIHVQQRTLFTEVCKAANITAADFAALTQVCAIDLTAQTVTKKEPPPAEKK